MCNQKQITEPFPSVLQFARLRIKLCQIAAALSCLLRPDTVSSNAFRHQRSISKSQTKSGQRGVFCADQN
jgi:hypothetical protein